MQTVVGTVVDPMADKALMTIVVVVLGVRGALPGTSNLQKWFEAVACSFATLRSHRKAEEEICEHGRGGRPS